ncbi:MAG: class I SAM-dependent methyltransferase [Thermotogota bacterium]|nr:class I SAM-dependent methyltransferase [Thermotogota bacterium]
MKITCGLCGSSKLESIQLDKPYHHCQRCDFIFMDDCNLLEENEERQRYLQHNNTIENTGYVKMFQTFIDNALQPKFAAADTILDYGSGPNPVFAQIMRRQGKAVDIYDPYFSPSIEYLHRQYDMITLTEVIEHIQYPIENLKPLKDCLTPNGLLAIMTRIHPGINQFEKWWYRKDNTHISFYSLKTAQVLATALGMSITKTDGERFFCLQNK